MGLAVIAAAGCVSGQLRRRNGTRNGRSPARRPGHKSYGKSALRALNAAPSTGDESDEARGGRVIGIRGRRVTQPYAT